jgi:hypothetical protein
LDGVTTAIAMKKYLENNGIDVVDAHVIQYGDKEFAVKKNDAMGDTMPVLVDFAHGKPMFVIHTDHHDRQAGAEDTKIYIIFDNLDLMLQQYHRLFHQKTFFHHQIYC